jgi:hypothetical protein
MKKADGNVKAETRFFWFTAYYLLAWTAFRLWFCGRFELIGDEAYNWLWAKNLDWCYFSKGPIVAVCTWVGITLFGDTEFGVRFANVILAGVTGFGIYYLATRLFSARVGFWSVVVISVTPLFVAGSYLMTMDTPYLFFWTLAAMVFWDAKDTTSIWRWMLVGLCVGLGILSKYTEIIQIFCFALFCLWVPAYRHHFRRWTFWGMVLTALACMTPCVLWNAQHAWCSVAHTLDRGQVDRAWQFSPGQFLSFLVQQTAVVFPLFFAGLAASLFRRDIRRENPVAFRFLVSLFLPLFLFYSLLAWNDDGLANWTAAGYISGLILMTATWLNLMGERPALRKWAVASLLLAVLVTVAIHVMAVYRLPGREDPLRHHRGVKDLARQVAEIRKQYQAQFVIGPGGYQTTSWLSFYSPNHAMAFIPSSPDQIRHQFSLWPGYESGYEHQNAIFVCSRPPVPDVLLKEFRSVEFIKETWSRFQGQPEKRYEIYFCRDLMNPQGTWISHRGNRP